MEGLQKAVCGVAIAGFNLAINCKVESVPLGERRDNCSKQFSLVATLAVALLSPMTPHLPGLVRKVGLVIILTSASFT